MPSETKINIEELSKKMQDVFPVPQVLAKILKTVNDPHASAASVEQIFKYEPSFTLKILTLANSAYYGSPGKVANIRAAITLLGFNLIKSIAIRASVNEFFNIGNTNAGFSGYELWKHSVGVGVCAKMISRRLKLGNAEDFFTMGILHDVGLIIEYQFYREGFLAVLNRLREKGERITRIEKEVLGIDHAALTEVLCRKWNIPQEISLALRYHHDPLNATGHQARRMACALYTANIIVKNSRYGFNCPSDEEVGPEHLELLGIEPLDLEVLGEDFDQEVLELMMFLE